MSDAQPVVKVSFIRAYRFEGWLFEFDRNKPLGPWPLKENFEPRKRAGKRFYDMFDKFSALPESEQEDHRVV